MQTTTVLGEARAALETVAGRIAVLLRSVPTATVSIPGSVWTVRDAAVHLADAAAVCSEVANGVRSPIAGRLDANGRLIRNGVHYREAIAVNTARRLADIPETDPTRLARLLLDGARSLVDASAGRPDDQPVSFHCGLPFTLAGLVCANLGEQIVHGFDIASAVGLPFPIDPVHAALAAEGVAPLLSLRVNTQTTEGLTVAYEVTLRGGGCWVVRFVDGEYSLEQPDYPSVDCIISADPVAYLLVSAGRVSQSLAMALGLISAAGRQPELALRFGDLFIHP
jgi:uncharacterized protein (TIGR03083 family)